MIVFAHRRGFSPWSLFDVIAASTSFCEAFHLAEDNVVGRPLTEIGAGEWNVPQLLSLLAATRSGAADIKAYELDLKAEWDGVRKLGYPSSDVEKIMGTNLRRIYQEVIG